jgi:hypothetical protein
MASPQLLINRLLKLGVVKKEDLRPCTAADIRRLERTHGVILPKSYKVFLRRMGRGAGEFLLSDHVFAYYETLLTLNRSVREHLSEVRLPATWFCFATRMGEFYLFFAADGTDDDPPVHYWSGRTHPRTKLGYRSFWD